LIKTKGEFVTEAFEELGLASYVFDLAPEQLQSALRKLDAMMSTWEARGLPLKYLQPGTSGTSALADTSGVPDRADEAIRTNLALRLAPGVGKQAPPELRAIAKQSLSALFAYAALPAEMQTPSGMPAGAGNGCRTFLDGPTDTLSAGPDVDLGVE
jgi:hypothetical protein